MPLFRTSEYYIKQILEKEVKLLTSRLKITGGPTESCVAQIKRLDIRSRWSTGSHFKVNSDNESK